MLLGMSDDDPDREASFVNLFTQNRVDGMIIATVSVTDTPINEDYINKKNIVFFNNLPNNSTMINAVTTDNATASVNAISYLHSLGHRKIAMIAGKQNKTAGYDRLVGYTNEMNRLGLTENKHLIQIGDYGEKSGYACMTQLLRDEPDLTAVYVANSQMTYGAIKAILNAGKSIPADISVVGFDVHDPSGLITPGITTIIQQEANIGTIACKLLLESINNPDEPVYQKIMLPSDLVIKQSCRSI